MLHLTAVAQKITNGFQVTFQFSEACPYLMAAAIECINNTPGCYVTSNNNNTIIAESSLPWELLHHLSGVDSLYGAPFDITFYMNAAIANATFNLRTTDLARHMQGRSLLPNAYVM